MYHCIGGTASLFVGIIGSLFRQTISDGKKSLNYEGIAITYNVEGHCSYVFNS